MDGLYFVSYNVKLLALKKGTTRFHMLLYIDCILVSIDDQKRLISCEFTLVAVKTMSQKKGLDKYAQLGQNCLAKLIKNNS